MQISNYYFGIDFGTTNTSVYLYRVDTENGKQYLNKEWFGDTDGNPFRSCIVIHKGTGEMTFGQRARKQSHDLPDDQYVVIRSFKSLLDTNEEVIAGQKRYQAVELTAFFLEFVKKQVDAACEKYGISLEKAVFSIPVDFSGEARKNLKTATELTGITVEQYITESTAAYLSKVKVKEFQAFSQILVVDWGGGTLDLSVLERKADKVYERAVYGVKIGGDDIDEAIARRLHALSDRNGISFEQAKNKNDLFLRAEQAKIAFSDDDSDFDLVIPGGKPVTLSYEEFCGMIRPVIQEHVLSAIDIVMRQANTQPAGIDAVILAGGSSQIQVFADYLESIFGTDKLKFEKESYQWMVAEGAAYSGVLGGDLKLNEDVCILMSDQSTYPILEKGIDGVGSQPPSVTFSLTDDAQDAHFIFTDAHNQFRYAAVHVRTKGYLSESLTVSARIDTDQIARIEIQNSYIAKDYVKSVEINKLRFYYDLSKVVFMEKGE